MSGGMNIRLIPLIPAALFLIYLWLIRPGKRRDIGAFTGRMYAHRGLWDDQLPENSLPAFRRAVSLGFGIETDVHITADGKLVIFHDDSLERMCGLSRSVSACTAKELRQCRLLGTDQTIPSFDEFLDTVDGRVPLIIEIKSDPRVLELCRLMEERLRAYQGPYCVESFDPRAVWWWRRHRPDVIRGQLTFGLTAASEVKRTPSSRFLATQVQNVLGRPDFIAAEAVSDNSLPMRLLHLFPAHRAAWTVRSPEQMAALKNRYDMQIFEKFIPGDADL